jgi:hypothetical protein
MRNILIAACLTLAGSLAMPQSPQPSDAGQQYGATSVETLKKAFALAMASSDDRDTQDKTKAYILKAWLDYRMIAAAEYEENLHHALDTWYANDKNWRKIPDEAWAKLSERDRGRLKDGVDPELMLSPRGSNATR